MVHVLQGLGKERLYEGTFFSLKFVSFEISKVVNIIQYDICKECVPWRSKTTN